MGLIAGIVVDSSVILAAERQREPIRRTFARLRLLYGHMPLAISTITILEIEHGIHRARSEEAKSRRSAFVEETFRYVTALPFTTDMAKLAARVEGEQAALGIVVPFADLLIGCTALQSNYALATGNVRHFRLIPGLTVLPV